MTFGRRVQFAAAEICYLKTHNGFLQPVIAGAHAIVWRKND